MRADMPTNLARTTERLGLAMSGLACGIFVAAAVSHADNALLQSIWMTLALVAAGGAGFYAGTTIPLGNRRFMADPAVTLSPAGTFLASAAALVAVIVLVFDLGLPTGWLAVLAASWLVGTMLQVSAAASRSIAQLRRAGRTRLTVSPGRAPSTPL
jgi:hypothetical protein